MFRRMLIAFSGLCVLPLILSAQSVRYQSQAISSRGAGIANATIAICSQPANTNTQPCSPLATLATSTSTTSGGANPLTADSFGNFFFYAAPGRYTVQIYGPAVSGQFVMPDVVLSCDPSGPCVMTGPINLTGAGSAAVQTALNNLVAGQVYMIPCGTYVGPTSIPSNVSLVAVGAQQNRQIALDYGGTVTAQTCVTLTYTANLVFTGIQNTHCKGISFDFGQGGFGVIFKDGSSKNTWDHCAITNAGSTSQPALQFNASTGAGTSNVAHNVFFGTEVDCHWSTTPFYCAQAIQFIGSGAVNAGGFATDNTMINTQVAGNIQVCVDEELNSDSNYLYDTWCNEDLGSAPANSAQLAINQNAPTLDQDANGGVVTYISWTGPVPSNNIRAGQTRGYTVSLVATAGTPVTSLGGTQLWTRLDLLALGSVVPQLTTGGMLSANAAATGACTSQVAGDICAAEAATSGILFLGTDGAGFLKRTGGNFFVNTNNAQMTQTVTSGTAAMTTAAIASLACGTTVTVANGSVSTGIRLVPSFTVAPASPNEFLILRSWPTAGNANFAWCNPTAASQTPVAETITWTALFP